MTEKTQKIRAVINRAGGPIDRPDSLIDAEIPTPAAPIGRDLLVEVRAVSVNPVDAVSYTHLTLPTNREV